MDDTKQTFENGSIQPYGLMALSQEEANYNPFGFSNSQGCGTCRWFMPSNNSCYVVQGAIVPTGISDLYSPLRPQDQMEELLEDFRESMGDVEEMEIGEASAANEKQTAKTTLFDRLFRRAKSETPEEKPQFDTPSGFKLVGENHWIAWYTNPYKDRDNEWFAEKAIDDDLAFMQETSDFPELWRYHIGKPKNSPVKHGKAIAVTKAGRFVIAFGEFDDTVLGRAFKEYYQENPNQELSHGFFYDPDMKKDGVYHKFHTFEISTLPPGVAANPYTYFGIKTGEKTMPAANEKAIADLKAALEGRIPADKLNEVLTAAAAKSAELDQHVSHKGQSEVETKEEDQPELSADTKAILGAFADLKTSLTTMSGEITALKAAMKPDMMEDDEDEEEGDGKKKPKKGYTKKQRATAQTLSPEITSMLRGLIEEKGANEEAQAIESRDLDPASFIVSKMIGGK